jgi:hypothetical protein
MADDTLRCPRCEYENIVLTCGFCIQCGNDLSHLLPQVETLSATVGTDSSKLAYSNNVTAASSHAAASSAIGSTLVDIDSGSAAAVVPLDQLIQDAAKLLGTPARETGSGWKMTLPTTKSRQQTVHVLRGNQDQAAELVSFLSICGEATTANAMRLLEWNGRLTGCAFAARTIGGKRMFVLTANWPTHVLDVGLIADTLRKIAGRADQVEAKLSSGPDKF